MALLNTKLKGTTLIESLIAMVVVMLCFGIATTVYVNVITSGNQVQKLKSQLLLKKIASETKQNRLFLDKKTSSDEIIVEKKIIQYGGMKNLLQLNLKAYTKNEKLLSEYNELVPNQ